MPQPYVIIGGDAAGMSAASKIKREQPEPKRLFLNAVSTSAIQPVACPTGSPV